MHKPHVVILGAGPAGLGAAYQLRRLDRAAATVIETREVVGGNAGSFEIGNQRVDYGSHRLHPACDPKILSDIKDLLQEDLLTRPRHGRIHLCGKWIHFPLRPLDLFLRLDKRFALGSMRDLLFGGSRPDNGHEDTLASVLREGLGSTICDHFYFPYARKIWGMEPEELSGVQARRRVSANSFPKLFRKVISQLPGFKGSRGGPFFYYPRNGYGQISEAYADAARANGANTLLGWKAAELRRSEIESDRWTVVAERDGEHRLLEADFVWSTIPLTVLARIIRPEPHSDVLEAARSLEFRSMLLVYLELPVNQFTEYDAHYFPDASVSITRLSEPKNYSAVGPDGRTIICAELPCSPGDQYWTMTQEQLAGVVERDLSSAGIPLPESPVGVYVKRLRQAYPIYQLGYERHFEVLDDWATGLPRLLAYGRQGLFAHDNTHHALYMAYAAADCLKHDLFDQEKWQEYRRVFDTHVVED